MLGSPIFHVNGDDPIAAVTTIQLAFEFRQQFQRDVVVDMYCYRRHGHNEGDEPRFTQPLMYSAIEDHPPISDIFFGHLVKFGDITPDEVRAFRAKFEEKLNNALQKSKVATKTIVPAIRKSLVVSRTARSGRDGGAAGEAARDRRGHHQGAGEHRAQPQDQALARRAAAT